MDGQTRVRHRCPLQLDSGRLHDSDHQQQGMGRSHYLQGEVITSSPIGSARKLAMWIFVISLNSWEM